MTADELRSLADTLEQCSPFRDSASVYQAANYLRACAEVMDKGPVAWRTPGPVTSEHPLECLVVVPALRQADGDWWLHGDVFLSPKSPIAWMPDTPEHLAMLAPLRLPEPMPDAELREVLWSADWRMGPLQDFARAIEAEVLRRVREANK